MAALVTALAALLVAGASAHDWAFGACPRVAPMPGMDLERFLGDWYVIEQFDTDSSCVKFSYRRVADNRLRVTKTRELPPLGPLRHNTYGGTLHVPDGGNEGKMRSQWPLNVAGKGDYIIFDTDYTTYAGLYDCQRLTGLMHRKSAAILSRTPSLDASTVQRLKSALRVSGVPTKHFDKVSHAGCATVTPDAPVLGVDPDTFPDLLDDAGDAVDSAVNWVFNGVRNLTDSVTGVSESFTPSTEFQFPEFTTSNPIVRENSPGKADSPSIEPVELTPESASNVEKTTPRSIQFSTEATTPPSAQPSTRPSTSFRTEPAQTTTTAIPTTVSETLPTIEFRTRKPTTTTYTPPKYPEAVDMDPIENEIEPVRDIVRTVVDIEI